MSSVRCNRVFLLLGVLVCVQLQHVNALKLNEVILLGTHNSMHLKSTPRLIDWDYEHPTFYDQVSKYNVRQFEFDMQGYDPVADDFDVYHVPIYDQNGTCYSVRECSAGLVQYALENPNHAPLFIYIDVKVAPDVVGWQIFDRINRQIWGERVFTFDELRGSYESPNERIRAEGWPELDAMRGRVVFFIDSGNNYEDVPNPQSFVLYGNGVPVDQPDAVVVSIGDVRGANITERFDAGFIFRCRSDSPERFRLPQPTCEENLDGLFDTMDREEPHGRVTSAEMTTFVNVAGGNLPGLAIDALFTSCFIFTGYFRRDQAPCISRRARLFTGDYPAVADDWQPLEYTIDQRDVTLNSGCHLISTDYEVPDPAGIYDVTFDTEFRLNPGPSSTSSPYTPLDGDMRVLDTEKALRNLYKELKAQLDEFTEEHGYLPVIDPESGVDIGQTLKKTLVKLERELVNIEMRP